MKIHKKRITPIVQVIIIVLGLFGAYYYFGPHNDNKAPQSPQSQSGDWKKYSNETDGYEISYPAQHVQHVTATEAGLLNPNKRVQKEKFTVTESLTRGTNLSSDSGLVIEVYDTPYLCQAEYLPVGFQDAQSATIKGVKYFVATSEGAGAGNFYQQMIYKTLQGNKCFVALINTHTTNIGNYEPGTVQEYDKAKYDNLMSQMLDTFKVTMVN